MFELCPVQTKCLHDKFPCQDNFRANVTRARKIIEKCGKSKKLMVYKGV